MLVDSVYFKTSKMLTFLTLIISLESPLCLTNPLGETLVSNSTVRINYGGP